MYVTQILEHAAAYDNFSDEFVWFLGFDAVGRCKKPSGNSENSDSSENSSGGSKFGEDKNFFPSTMNGFPPLVRRFLYFREFNF